MNINNNIIIRIDDRFIHGQVIIGWVKVLNLNNIIVANNRLLNDKLKVQMMKLAIPTDINFEFLNIADAVTAYKENKWNKFNSILLLESFRDAYAFISAGCSVEKINVGGIHAQGKREQIAQNIALDDEDIDYAKKLIGLKVDLEVQALPSDEGYNLEKILKKG